jgi:hypothetical protein
MGGATARPTALPPQHGVAEAGIGTLRVPTAAPTTWRCARTTSRAAGLASRRGARSFVTMGHSFGGAIALRAALMLGRHCAGVVTFATQSAGCEQVGAHAPEVPVLLFHGDRDELLPAMVSETVRQVIGHGEVVLLPGNGHLLSEAGPELRARLRTWVPGVFAEHDATRRD